MSRYQLEQLVAAHSLERRDDWFSFLSGASSALWRFSAKMISL